MDSQQCQVGVLTAGTALPRLLSLVPDAHTRSHLLLELQVLWLLYSLRRWAEKSSQGWPPPCPRQVAL